MADFTSTMTNNTSVGDSVLSAWNQQTLFEAEAELVADQLATVKFQGGAATIYFPRFAQMTASTTALTDKQDPDSTEITDSAANIAPLEFGAVVTYTNKANLAAGGRVDLAAAKLVGVHMGTSLDALAQSKLEAFSTTIIYPNGKTAKTALDSGDVLDKKFAGQLYNKLARKNIPSISGGSYFAIAHEDVLFDLREDASVGGWVSVNQYSNLTTILRNEVGMFQGIRWLRSKNSTVESNVNGTVDGYYVSVLGSNALGKAVSEEPHIVISGPFDKLLRFVNIGWYGVLQYGVVDTDNMVLGRVASSVGTNT